MATLKTLDFSKFLSGTELERLELAENLVGELQAAWFCEVDQSWRQG